MGARQNSVQCCYTIISSPVLLRTSLGDGNVLGNLLVMFRKYLPGTATGLQKTDSSYHPSRARQRWSADIVCVWEGGEGGGGVGLGWGWGEEFYAPRRKRDDSTRVTFAAKRGGYSAAAAAALLPFLYYASHDGRVVAHAIVCIKYTITLEHIAAPLHQTNEKKIRKSRTNERVTPRTALYFGTRFIWREERRGDQPAAVVSTRDSFFFSFVVRTLDYCIHNGYGTVRWRWRW